MRTTRMLRGAAAAVALAVAGGAGALADSHGGMPFGTPADVSYAADLWAALEEERYVGADTIRSVPYRGQEPHGFLLESLDGTVALDGTDHEVIVKKNYGPAGVEKAALEQDRMQHLAAVTVMLRRSGYDPDNQDWFWVKYAKDGSVMTNPKDMKLAGRVAKGTGKGCIACHAAAPGGDLVYNNDRYAR